MRLSVIRVASLSLILAVLSPPPTLAQREVEIPVKKQAAFVIDFKPPYDKLIVDIDENNFIETESLDVAISPQTTFVNKSNKPLDRTLIRPGAEIVIDGERLGSRLTANKIRVETPVEKWDVDVKGYFESLDGDKAWVDGRAVKLNPGTVVLGTDEWKGKTFNSFNDMQLGSEVKLTGTRRADGVVYATRATTEPNLFNRSDRELKAAVEKQMVLPANLSGGRGKVAGKDVKFADSLELQKYITKVGYKLIPRYEKDLPNDYPGKLTFRFAVIEDDSFNAFSLPDGSVFVHTGLLKQIKNEAQLAAILGHEIAHATYEHTRKKKDNLSGDLACLAILAVGPATGTKEGAIASAYGYLACMNNFGRNAEDEADRVGLYYMAQAGYDVREAPKVWREISKNTKEDPLNNVIYSDHSTARQRLKNLNRQIAYNYYDADFSHDTVGDREYMNVVGVYFGWIPKPIASPTRNPVPNSVNGPGSPTPINRNGSRTNRPVLVPKSKGEGFQSLLAKLRSAVNTRNKIALKELMAPRFDWALDGYVSRDEAFNNIGQIVGWNKFWLAAKRALAGKPAKCSNTLNMNDHSGFCVSASVPRPIELVFELGSDGVWYWSAFPGD